MKRHDANYPDFVIEVCYLVITPKGIEPIPFLSKGQALEFAVATGGCVIDAEQIRRIHPKKNVSSPKEEPKEKIHTLTLPVEE